MTRAQRVRALGIMAVQVGITSFGLAKLARRPAERIPGSKRIWAVVILANLAGTLAVRFGRLAADPRPADAT
jgi:hypothetical protein